MLGAISNAQKSNSHVLNNIVHQAVRQENASQKTLDSIAQRILSVKNSCTAQEFSSRMEEACSALREIKQHRLFEKITGVFSEHSINYALDYISDLRSKNVQPDFPASLYDVLTLSQICEMQSQRTGGEIHTFSNMNSLFSYLETRPDASFKAVTRMIKGQSLAEDHYVCIDINKKNNNIEMMVYEPSWIPDFGFGMKEGEFYFVVQNIRDALEKQFISAPANTQNVKIGIVEMDSQRSPRDCAIYSVFIASALCKNPEISTMMFGKLLTSGHDFNRFYAATAKEGYIDSVEDKTAVNLPAPLLKLSSSSSSLKSTEIGQDIVNKKGETLQQRIERDYLQRGENRYSVAVEKKREIYLQRLNDSHAG